MLAEIAMNKLSEITQSTDIWLVLQCLSRFYLWTGAVFGFLCVVTVLTRSKYKGTNCGTFAGIIVGTILLSVFWPITLYIFTQRSKDENERERMGDAKSDH